MPAPSAIVPATPITATHFMSTRPVEAAALTPGSRRAGRPGERLRVCRDERHRRPGRGAGPDVGEHPGAHAGAGAGGGPFAGAGLGEEIARVGAELGHRCLHASRA